MSSAARRIVLLALLATGLVVFTGCENTREHKAGREGLPEKIGNVDYNVYITRELNLRDREDQGYYQGPEAPPGFALYGVFLQACNPSSNANQHWTPSSNFEIEDTAGNKFKPLQLPANNIWAYKARPLKEHACIPETGSLAAAGPTNGALLIFRLPLATLENRPLDLRITAPPSSSGERDSGVIELDI